MSNPENTPVNRRGLRGHAIFFSFWFVLGAGVVCSHVYQWKLPMPGHNLDASAPAQIVDAGAIRPDEATAAF